MPPGAAQNFVFFSLWAPPSVRPTLRSGPQSSPTPPFGARDAPVKHCFVRAQSVSCPLFEWWPGGPHGSNQSTVPAVSLSNLRDNSSLPILAWPRGLWSNMKGNRMNSFQLLVSTRLSMTTHSIVRGSPNTLVTCLNLPCIWNGQFCNTTKTFDVIQINVVQHIGCRFGCNSSHKMLFPCWQA